MFEQKLTENITKNINEVRTEYNSDIFGFLDLETLDSLRSVNSCFYLTQGVPVCQEPKRFLRLGK